MPAILRKERSGPGIRMQFSAFPALEDRDRLEACVEPGGNAAGETGWLLRAPVQRTHPQKHAKNENARQLRKTLMAAILLRGPEVHLRALFGAERSAS
jgi:hypothetical protein